MTQHGAALSVVFQPGAYGERRVAQRQSRLRGGDGCRRAVHAQGHFVGYGVGVQHALHDEVVGQTQAGEDVFIERHADVVAQSQHAVRGFWQIERLGQCDVLDDGYDVAGALDGLALLAALRHSSELVGGVGIEYLAAHADDGVDGFRQQTLVGPDGVLLDKGAQGGPLVAALQALLQLHGIQNLAVDVVVVGAQRQRRVGGGVHQVGSHIELDALGMRLEVDGQIDIVANGRLSVRREEEVQAVDVYDVLGQCLHLQGHLGRVVAGGVVAVYQCDGEAVARGLFAVEGH